MASYHFSVQIISRAKGRSAVAAAAYRSGTKLTDSRAGAVYDYSKRRGVAHAEILLPEDAAPWLADREALWNHAEGIEKRKDAQLAREINMALPHELTAAQRLDLVRSFVQAEFVGRGMVADFALHEPVPEKGDDPRNFHAHVMLSLRQADAHGFRRVKTREWNADALLENWRQAWAGAQNRALEEARQGVRVDHRSLKAQRHDATARGDRAAAAALDRVPEIHVGPKARAADRKGRAPQPSRSQVRATARPAGGRWVSARSRERRARVVAYPMFDRGSRSSWNASLVDRNMRRTYARIDKYERQAIRLRKREASALKLLALGRLDADRARIARRHVNRSRGLLAEIERLIASLLKVRGLWDRRHRELVRVDLRGVFDGRRPGRRRST